MTEDGQHQALYRRYRPQTPQEVLGQDHVVRALTGAIREGRLAHAFLFCGPRGTGKTSTARVLAKMVNCERGPTEEPCGKCPQCASIRAGTHVDVVEIDAASHGGVEDARDLREKAPTAPMVGREKVYIIDEAQRLSREAFDALLKVFEEPPPGVRFVLATTEPHKMPATIVGRCQRFDFRRFSIEHLRELMQKIAAEEGIALADSAAIAIARQAEGSARDALSLLDQATVLGGPEVGDATIAALVGAPRQQVQHELAEAIAAGDARATFEIVDGLVQDGEDLRNVTAETLGHFRNLLLVQAAPGQPDLLDIPPDAYDAIRAQASKFSPAEIARVIALLLAAQSDMRWTTSPRLSLELALIRATLPETDPNPAGLVARIERLERLANVDVAVSEQPQAAPAPEPPPTAEPTPTPASDVSTSPRAPSAAPAPAARAAPAAPAPATSAAPAPTARAAPAAAPAPADAGNVDTSMLRRGWPTLLEHVRSPVLRAQLERATVAGFDGESVELAFPPGMRFSVEKVEAKADDVREALAATYGVRPQLRCVVRESTVGPIVEEDEAPDDAEALRRLQEVLGAEVAADPEPAE